MYTSLMQTHLCVWIVFLVLLKKSLTWLSSVSLHKVSRYTCIRIKIRVCVCVCVRRHIYSVHSAVFFLSISPWESKRENTIQNGCIECRAWMSKASASVVSVHLLSLFFFSFFSFFSFFFSVAGSFYFFSNRNGLEDVCLLVAANLTRDVVVIR